MLQIKNISKQYKTGELIQNALSDVSLNFRDNEFVSILGPSGSGKTTLLNIIGGLDRYDKGDLIINNISTKNYKDRNWDSYRNHTIGFVFQSYNLIPHQTVLTNVELALTIGGISKKERRKKALEVLEKVGLKEQVHKKPNQMSGGQMQRVAIARALVNNPNIVLADEPTGALDTQTSIQVMELLKQVANDRLVIMVTHNPELANKYSTRIVNLKDGKILGDTNPFNPKKKNSEKPKHKNLGKSSMSLLTAFSLSLKNLMTKKGRTALTSFAGSIGIIGIALILALSTGFQNYINKIQEDTLTSYPLTITSQTADTTSILLSMVTKNKDTEETNTKNTVKESQVIKDMFSKVGTNDLKHFKEYLDQNKEQVNQITSTVQYIYSAKPQVFTKNSKNEITQLNPSKLISNISGNSNFSENSNPMLPASNASIFNEMIDNQEMQDSKYNVLAGKWPEKYNEVLLILPESNAMSDLLVYSLGLRDTKELEDMISKIMKSEKVENNNQPLEFTYEDLMNIPLKLVDSTDKFKYNEKYDIYEDMSEDKNFMQDVYDNSQELKIVGIVSPKDTKSSMSSTTSGIGYTKKLTEYVIEKASQSAIVKKQLSNKDKNVFNNKNFDEEEDTKINFQNMISIDKKALSSAFGGKFSETEISAITQSYMKEISSSITTDTTEAQKAFKDNLVTITQNILNDYIDKNNVDGVATIKLTDVDEIVTEGLSSDTNTELLEKLETNYIIPKETFSSIYSQLINGFIKQYIITLATDKVNASTIIVKDTVENTVKAFSAQEPINEATQNIAQKMTEASMQKNILSKVGELMQKITTAMANSFKIDENKIASAFKFNMNEDEMKRLIETMFSKSTTKQNADKNLISLGYQELENPTSISLYFKDFNSKEKFIKFLDDYNKKVESQNEDMVIKYTDITGVLISSVKTIVDSVSYVLIAFVSISLIVSSIMIGIITYISVIERTKEIGILRAIGASKRNISSIFNAETFIIGLFSGLLGIGITLILLIPINQIIKTLTGNIGITAVLPITSAIILIILSVILTLIGGLIPSKQVAKKDPVLALRSE